MPETHMMMWFVLSAIVLLITPGPAVLFVVTRTIQQGRRAGFVTVLGLCCGGLVHVAAAVLGISALLASSAAAFASLKLLGAAYLFYLGFKALLSSGELPGNLPANSKSVPRLFVDGFIVNLLNPKTAIFFLAFLPQFVNPEGSSVTWQLAVMGILFISLALITDGLYTILAGSFRGWIAKKPQVFCYQRYVSASVYLGLGISTALSGRQSK